MEVLFIEEGTLPIVYLKYMLLGSIQMFSGGFFLWCEGWGRGYREKSFDVGIYHGGFLVGIFLLYLKKNEK